ncbi:MAG: HD domain-containing protein [Polyangiales bacterium]
MVTTRAPDFAAIPPSVRELCARLRACGHRAWIVGGCVRDLMRGAPVADWDVCTDAQPKQVQKAFRHVIPTGIAHGTVTVRLPVDDGFESYEVTTLRGEAAYSDGRRPDAVTFVDDIVEDLARRDFTFNAIAIDLDDCTVIDPFEGVRDLERGILRAVGNPRDRFAEDGLRALRAARFVAALEVELDPDTASALRPSLDTYRKVSAERVRDEWVKTLKARRPSRAFEVMRAHGLLEVSAPELLPQWGCTQNKYHRYDVWGHAMACVDACVGDPALRLAALLHDIGKPATRAMSEKTHDYTFYEHEKVGAEMVEPLLQRLRFSNEERARVVHLVRHHLVCYEPGWSNAAVRRCIQRVGRDRLPDLYALNEADLRGKDLDVAADLGNLIELRKRVEETFARGEALSVRDLAIGGKDLMERLALPPGPRLGLLLDRLLEEVIEDPSRNRLDLLLLRAIELLPTLPSAKAKSKAGTDRSP